MLRYILNSPQILYIDLSATLIRRTSGARLGNFNPRNNLSDTEKLYTEEYLQNRHFSLKVHKKKYLSQRNSGYPVYPKFIIKPIPMKMGTIDYPETSINNYQNTPFINPDQFKSQPHRGRSLKPYLYTFIHFK